MNTTYLASIECECPTCGVGVVDLIDVRNAKWLIQCGWWCMRTWLIDPIPGVLDEDDAKQQESEFILRGGQFDGQTFTQIWSSGNEWYVRDIARLSKRQIVRDKANQWLKKYE